MGLGNNKLALVWMMVWHWTDDKLLYVLPVIAQVTDAYICHSVQLIEAEWRIYASVI